MIKARALTDRSQRIQWVVPLVDLRDSRTASFGRVDTDVRGASVTSRCRRSLCLASAHWRTFDRCKARYRSSRCPGRFHGRSKGSWQVVERQRIQGTVVDGRRRRRALQSETIHRRRRSSAESPSLPVPWRQGYVLSLVASPFDRGGRNSLHRDLIRYQSLRSGRLTMILDGPGSLTLRVR